MTFKTTLALTLALGTFAVTGAAQEAPKSSNFNKTETVFHSGFFSRGFSWLPENVIDRDLVSKRGDNPAETSTEVRRPSLLKRLSWFFKGGTQLADDPAVRTARLKTNRSGSGDSTIKQERFGYVLARDLGEMRSAAFGRRQADKGDRRAAAPEGRQARLHRPVAARDMQARGLSPDEENKLSLRFASVGAEQSGRDVLAARMGPDRGQASLISRAFAGLRVHTPVTSDRKYGRIVERYARAYGVPVELAHAVIKVESNYRPDIRGRAGEVGLMQIKPATARLMGYSGSTKELYDPENNIKYGMLYLAKAHKLGGGTTCGTILKYNAGHGARRMNPVSARYCAKVKKHLAGV